MKIENFKCKIVYNEGVNGFEIDHTIDGDGEVKMHLEVGDEGRDIYLDPLTVRVMIEQLQNIKKQQGEK